MKHLDKYFYKSQRDWILDDSPLKIALKSRQIGFSFANSFRLVLLVSARKARLDAYISSSNQFQAKLQLEDCARWAEILHLGSTTLGEIVFDKDTNSSAYVLQFANGRRIYSLSSNPNALAGKRGHVTLDEFALHPDQRLLYRVAKPVTTWGGQLLTNAYQQVVWVYRAINALAEQVANIPFLFSAGERGRENLITSGPLMDFYNRPHPMPLGFGPCFFALKRHRRAGLCKKTRPKS